MERQTQGYALAESVFWSKRCQFLRSIRPHLFRAISPDISRGIQTRLGQKTLLAASPNQTALADPIANVKRCQTGEPSTSLTLQASASGNPGRSHAIPTILFADHQLRCTIPACIRYVALPFLSPFVDSSAAAATQMHGSKATRSHPAKPEYQTSKS